MTKKLHLFLTMLLCAVSSAVWADTTINITAAEVNEGGKDPISFVAAKNDGSTAPTYNEYNNDYRIYAKGSLTISSSVKIKKVVFNLSAQGKKRLAPITCDNGTIATQAVGDETVTWTGDANEFTLTVGDKAEYGSDGETKAGQLCFSSVDVTYEGSYTGKTATKLTLNPSSISLEVGKTQALTVSTNNTEGALTVVSSDPSIATVSGSNGSYTVKGIAIGTTTITVNQAESNNYTSASATLDVAVKDALPEGTLFNETFDKVDGKGGRDNTFTGSVGTSKADDLTDEIGWTFSNNCGAFQCIKLGASSADWTATTREINLTGTGTLTFNAAGWGSGTNNFSVTAEGGQVSGDTGITLTNGEWKKYTVTISEANGSVKIKFSGHRGFIDDVVVVEGGDTPQPGEDTYNSIAEIMQLTPKTSGKLKFNNVQVLYANGKDLYAKDNTGAINFFFEKDESFNYTAGQKLNGTATVTYDVYNELPEIIKVADASLTATNGTATPVQIGLSANLPDYVCELVKLTGNFKVETDGTRTNYYLTDGTNTIQIYNKWKLTDFDLEQVVEGSQGTATGIVVTYKSGENIYYEVALTALEYQSAGKIEPELAFSATEVTATLGQPFTEPTLSAAPDFDFGIVKYTSSNQYVATVDEATGKVTLVGAGTTTITATSEAYDEFLAGEASYKLTVNKPEAQPGTDKFELVTDASTLAAGDVIILVGKHTVEEADKYWGMAEQSGNFRIVEEVTPEADGTIIPNSYVQQITLEGATDAWYMNTGDGYLYANSNDKNNMATGDKETAGDNAKAKITTEEVALSEDSEETKLETTIVFQGAYSRNDFRFNYNNGNPRFSCYASTTSVKKELSIYRKVKTGGLLGDVDGDGFINMMDVTAVINYILSKTPEKFIFENADMDKDGYINMMDVTAIINIILGK